MKEKINSALDRFYEHGALAVIVTILVFYAVWKATDLLSVGIVTEYAVKLGLGLAMSLAFMWLRKDHMYSCGLRRNGMKNLKVILPLLLLTLVQFIRPIASYGKELLRADLLIYATVLAVEAGICEEFMVRGLPLGNTLLHKKTRKGVMGLALLSSLVFGLLHLGNLFNGGETIPVITQVVYAVGMGMVYAAIYLRTGSIIPSIILHALWDFAQFLDPANLANGAISGAPRGLEELISKLAEIAPEAAVIGPVFFVIIQLLMALFWFCIALFLLRKSKWEEIKANFTKE